MRISSAFLIALVSAILASAGIVRAQVVVPVPQVSPLPLVIATPRPVPYEFFVRDMQRQNGLFNVLTHDHDVYLELNADQLGKTYLMATTIAGGIGGYGLAPGQYAGEHVIRFQRVGFRLLLIERNPHFVAKPNTPEATSLAASVGDSIWMALPIVAEDEKTKRIVISAAPFINDLDNIGQFLSLPRGGLLGSNSYRVDPSRSYFEWAKSFPQNVNLLATMTFAGRGSAGTSSADPSSLLMRIHYSFVALPENDAYLPRSADDRVGYFETVRKDFSQNGSADPYLRYVDRWDLNKGPIVFYLTDEIPARYKATIRSAILRWNAAFAGAGYPRAVAVRDQPKDPAWDPEDIRYSTVRWASNDQPDFTAEGQGLVNPFTGEIFRATVILDGEAIRAMQRGYVARVTSTLDQDQSYQINTAANAAYALTSLQLQPGGLSAAQRERYVQDIVASIVLHETGHAFGLRHNFAGSTLYSAQQLRSGKFTARHGISASVMDYLPVNLWPKGTSSGAPFQLQPGPYDYWAIKYGYQRLPAKTTQAEFPYLKAIADESTRPEYAYGTDEDAVAPNGYDPHIQQMDLSNDPLGFDNAQLRLLRRDIAVLDARYPRDDRSFVEERNAFDTLLGQYRLSALLATRYVAGYYTSRAHRGQRGARPPFRPVSRSEERRAFDVLAQNVLSANTFRFPPKLLNDLGAARYDVWGEPDPYRAPQEDAITDRVDEVQATVLYSLFSVAVMNRLIESQARVINPRDTMSLHDLFAWSTDAIWDSLGNPNLRSVDQFHRMLQRNYTDLLTEMIVLNGPVKRSFFGFVFKLPPIEAQELARYELEGLLPRLEAGARNSRLDVATRAHFSDMAQRIGAALKAQETRG